MACFICTFDWLLTDAAELTGKTPSVDGWIKVDVRQPASYDCETILLVNTTSCKPNLLSTAVGSGFAVVRN